MNNQTCPLCQCGPVPCAGPACAWFLPARTLSGTAKEQPAGCAMKVLALSLEYITVKGLDCHTD